MATADGDWARPSRCTSSAAAGAAATHDEAGFVLKALAEAGEFDAAARTLARVPAGLLRPTAAAKLRTLVDAAEAARVDEADGADDAAAAAVAALPELERAVEFTSHKLVAIAARTEPPRRRPGRRPRAARRTIVGAHDREGAQAAGDGDRRRPRGDRALE